MQIVPVFEKMIEIWLHVFFKVIDFSMDLIKQKYENR